MKESKAAKRLYIRVNKMISKMDRIVNQLQQDGSNLKAEIKDATDVPESKQYVVDCAVLTITIRRRIWIILCLINCIFSFRSQLIQTEELIDAIQRFQNVSDPARLERIADVVENLDADRDGQVDIDDVLKVGYQTLLIWIRQMTLIWITNFLFQ